MDSDSSVILQVMPVQGKYQVAFAHAGFVGNISTADVVMWGLVDEQGFTYVAPMILDAGQIRDPSCDEEYLGIVGPGQNASELYGEDAKEFFKHDEDLKRENQQ